MDYREDMRTFFEKDGVEYELTANAEIDGGDVMLNDMTVYLPAPKGPNGHKDDCRHEIPEDHFSSSLWEEFVEYLSEYILEHIREGHFQAAKNLRHYGG